ncbi:FAD-dependent oxidoreductase [Asticcacaulis sp. BYS171W]|uniref:FAD-dependent oxidoreductase n=1 Tax=Asticcacaulis aquaticus TaxID=2984212 RepID=A0ABT5HUZ7_9CAUL|nr:FAD-dependent oxidoreductase [Asticcacaulis aquaticus]MDC7683883.1 FAD-dependent oxidoreductase [Asticcacaulis aquaticus]
MVSAYSVIVIGGGIVGLSVGLRALDHGLSVTLVAKDAVEASTSALSAGMIAPAMEALTEADPKLSYARYIEAQKHWPSFAEDLGLSEILELAQPAVWLWSGDSGPSPDEMMQRFSDMGAKGQVMREEDLAKLGYHAPFQAIEIVGEWLMAAEPVLAYMKSVFVERGGRWIADEVVQVGPQAATLSDGQHLEAAHVVVCAGFDSSAFTETAPSLGALKPIKGHLLDTPQKADPALAGRMVRSPWGYWVFFDGLTKFGATMQTGRADLDIEPGVVASLAEKARKFTPDSVAGLNDAVPRVGVRAATPDGWPMIGRDPGGVYVATGMRRNGWIYGPYAADVLMAQIGGQGAPEGSEIYDPQRFTPH